MKKALCTIIACLIIFSTMAIFPSENNVKKAEALSIPVEKHLILNADGSYGGSYNEALYGKGAPKNGEYDVSKSEYYIVNDFYNTKSTNEEYPLTLYPNFMPYQQTMQNSSAFACLVMAFNMLNMDIANTYSEVSLVEKYQQFTGESINDSDITQKKLNNFIFSLNSSFTEGVRFGAGLNRSYEGDVSSGIASSLNNGDIILVRYRSPADYGWKLIIGLDQMGTESPLDDTLIFANPYDVSDHYQDGYSTARLSNFVVWWADIDDKLMTTLSDDLVVISAGYNPNFERVDRDTTIQQHQYELHHILNADGTYGGTRDESKYGSISTFNGDRNVPFSTYYKINDYSNMGDEGSRLLLKKYNTYQQTMSASCGICSMMSVLKYYGKKIDESYEVKLCEEYFEITKKNVYPSGTNATYNARVLNEKYNMKATASFTKKGEALTFPTYETYRDFIKEKLKKDTPIMISIKNRGGHWVTIIGIDDMGTDNIYDDVIITSDSSDYWDHYQDGYATYSATGLYRNHYSNDLSIAYSMVYFDRAPISIGLVVGISLGAIALVGGGLFVVIKKKKAK